MQPLHAYDTFNRVKQDSIVSIARRDISRQKRGIVVARLINLLAANETRREINTFCEQ